MPNPVALQAEKKSNKPLSPEERYREAQVRAKVYLDASRARITKEIDKYTSVANSNYWFYGYFGGNMMATMAACLALSNRITILRTYSGWIALAGGYFGGKGCLGLHTSYLLSALGQKIDGEVAEAERMDKAHGNVVPDYAHEVERLQTLKYELMPYLPEAVEARTKHQDVTLDDRADALVEAYMKRKEALRK